MNVKAHIKRVPIEIPIILETFDNTGICKIRPQTLSLKRLTFELCYFDFYETFCVIGQGYLYDVKWSRDPVSTESFYFNNYLVSRSDNEVSGV